MRKENMNLITSKATIGSLTLTGQHNYDKNGTLKVMVTCNSCGEQFSARLSKLKKNKIKCNCNPDKSKSHYQIMVDGEAMSLKKYCQITKLPLPYHQYLRKLRGNEITIEDIMNQEIKDDDIMIEDYENATLRHQESIEDDFLFDIPNMYKTEKYQIKSSDDFQNFCSMRIENGFSMIYEMIKQPTPQGFEGFVVDFISNMITLDDDRVLAFNFLYDVKPFLKNRFEEAFNNLTNNLRIPF